MRNALIIAFNFPPMSGTSAAQRTLSLCRYLPDHGWVPVVLCPKTSAYPHTDPSQLSNIPKGTVVRRSLALDASRHLGIGGRHLPLLDIPDRWASWWLSAVPGALTLVRKYRPSVILSTFPLATAHLIGLSVHRLTGIPWVADFRDVMIEHDYPSGRARRKAWRWIERSTISASASSIFTTPGALQLYARRYPDKNDEHWIEIGNAFEEDDFLAVESDSRFVADRRHNTPLQLVHSGVLYPKERNPSAFFEALADLKAKGIIASRRVKIVLRGARHEQYCRKQIAQYGLDDIVSLAPVIPYFDALGEMLRADGLIVLQASVCNNQIPAKVYEYFRARRPILALTDKDGDTAALVRDAGIDSIAALDSASEIADKLSQFLSSIESGTACVASEGAIRKHSRRARVAQFARVFNNVAQVT